MSERADGWTVTGPEFKPSNKYMARDGDNPEAAWPGYGWPLGSECWFYRLEGHGWRLIATGLTRESAAARVEVLIERHADTPER